MCLDVDILVGGAAHNILLPHVFNALLRLARAGKVRVALIGVPCSSFSILREHDGVGPPPLRSRLQPHGLPGLSPPDEATLHASNCMALFACLFALEVAITGGQFIIEQPADVGVPGTPWHWPAKAHHAHLLCTRWMILLISVTGASTITFPQCALAAPFRKWTVLVCSEGVYTLLRPLALLRCNHGHAGHDMVARGLDSQLRSRPRLAAAYPQPMCFLLGQALVHCARNPLAPSFTIAALRSLAWQASQEGGNTSPQPSHRRRVSMAPTVASLAFRSSDPPLAISDERRIVSSLPLAAARSLPRPYLDESPSADGTMASEVDVFDASSFLRCLSHRTIKIAINSARSIPPRYSSFRNVPPASRAEALMAAFPVPHPPLIHPITSISMAAVFGVVPDASTQLSGRSSSLAGQFFRQRWAAANLAAVPITALFEDGVYHSIEEWLSAAAVAMAALRAKKSFRRPPTLVITQRQLKPFARGIVWDTRNPQACVPLLPSDRHTQFPGDRQINRAAVRRMAEDVGWLDHDLLLQVGEGGVESRSECPMDIQLSFHHSGLRDSFDVADAAIAKDIAEGWVEPPHPTIPWVPIQLIPNNVVLQDRQRVESGRLVDYVKGRLTTDLSNGSFSVNGGLDALEKAVTLPSIRQLAMGCRIVQEAGTEDGTPAAVYAFDLSSAYRYVVSQRIEWYLQCFFWQTEGGAAGCATNTRLVFGGAHTPQRFERFTVLPGMAGRLAVAAVDAANPYPPGVERWRARRLYRWWRTGSCPSTPTKRRRPITKCTWTMAAAPRLLTLSTRTHASKVASAPSPYL